MVKKVHKLRHKKGNILLQMDENLRNFAQIFISNKINNHECSYCRS